MRISKGKKVFLIVSIAVLLSIVFITPRVIRSVRYLKKVAYIADLLTGERAEEEISVEELIEAFVDKSNPAIYRKYAVSKLGHSMKSPTAVEPLIGVLLDETEKAPIRGKAAFTLGLIGDERAIEPLLQTMDDANYDVQINVLRALNDFRDERVVEALIPVAKSDADVKKRTLAAKGLIIDTPEVIKVLINLIKNEPGARYIAIKSLGETRTRNEEAFQILLEVLNGEHMEESYGSDDRRLWGGTAAIALGKIGDKRAVEPLLKILDEDKSILFIDAAIALGDLGDRRALAPLRKRMEEKKNKAYIMKDLNEAYRKLTQNTGGHQL